MCIFCHPTVYKGKSSRLQAMTVLLDDKIALSTKRLSICMYHISSPTLSVCILYAYSSEYNIFLKFTPSPRIYT